LPKRAVGLFVVSSFAFHPELLEHRSEVLEVLGAHDYQWFASYSCVDLLHDLFGLEVCGIPEREDAVEILKLLEEQFPDWPYTNVYYYPYERDRGWKVIIHKLQDETPTWL